MGIKRSGGRKDHWEYATFGDRPVSTLSKYSPAWTLTSKMVPFRLSRWCWAVDQCRWISTKVWSHQLTSDLRALYFFWICLQWWCLKLSESTFAVYVCPGGLALNRLLYICEHAKYLTFFPVISLKKMYCFWNKELTALKLDHLPVVSKSFISQRRHIFYCGSQWLQLIDKAITFLYDSSFIQLFWWVFFITGKSLLSFTLSRVGFFFSSARRGSKCPSSENLFPFWESIQARNF